MTEPTPPAAATPQPAAPLTEAEDKQWASFAHFGGILGPLPALIIYLIFKDRGAKTRVEAKEALNWQITFVAGLIILGILNAVVTAIVVGIAISSGADLGILVSLFGFLPFLLWVANVILSILGGVKVNGGGSYRYPFAIRLIK